MRPLWAIPAVLALAAPAFAEPLKVTASVEEGNTLLKVAVEAPALPKDAVVMIRVTREFVTPTRRLPVVVKEALLPFQADGRAEADYPMGNALTVPGRYRIRVSFDREMQAPGLLRALGERLPEPAEAVLADGTVSKPHLAAILKEQGFLADAVTEVGSFLDKMNEMEALVAQDRKKGLEAWEAWRAKAVPGLEKIILHSREIQDSYFPDACDRFVECYLFSGLFQMEGRKFAAAKAGGGYHGTGFLKNSPTSTRNDLTPYREAFWREAAYYRLVVLSALYSASEGELARQDAKPDRERWTRRRRDWDATLELWQADLVPSGPGELTGREALAALGTALATWWDAEEARRFPPSGTAVPPDAGDACAGKRQAVKERFQQARAIIAPP